MLRLHVKPTQVWDKFNLLLLLNEWVGTKCSATKIFCRLNQIYSHGLCLRPNAEKEGQTCQSPRGEKKIVVWPPKTQRVAPMSYCGRWHKIWTNLWFYWHYLHFWVQQRRLLDRLQDATLSLLVSSVLQFSGAIWLGCIFHPRENLAFSRSVGMQCELAWNVRNRHVTRLLAPT